jgi:predicted phosphodiesterase
MVSERAGEDRLLRSSDGSEAQRVLVAGDTHGNLPHFRSLIDVAKREGCQRIVQVGDFGYWPHYAPFHEQVNRLAMEAGVTVYWLDGNHENFDALEEAINTEAPSPQQMLAELWYLPRGCTWEWDGCRFMALGGAYSIDKDYRVEGQSWWPQELLTTPQVVRAMGRGPVNVLFTHDAPEGVCPIISNVYKGDEISRGNRLGVSAVVHTLRPRLLVHGHYHHRYTGWDGRTKVEGLSRDDDGKNSWLVIEPRMWADDSHPAPGTPQPANPPVERGDL